MNTKEITQIKDFINSFKDEFRLMCTDSWGCAMEAGFEATGQMCLRWLDIPKEWEYKAGLSPTDDETYFHETFENCTDDELIAIANFLFRYCQMLKHYGKDY